MAAPPADQPSALDPVRELRETFRRHLETFYATLKLAPPYHSVEQGILHLTKILHALPVEERRRIANDPAAQWTYFQEAFVASGLNLKHRGILAGMARRRESLDLPAEYHGLLDTFLM
ncbi:MAG: hypothetical protein AB7G48_03675 [Nitrospiraceae bacterium]